MRRCVLANFSGDRGGFPREASRSRSLGSCAREPALGFETMVLMAKPGWVSHDGQPIFSVDVHPDGTRFATAGQDGTIKIWALAPVLDKASEQDESVPRLLATLSGHEGAVNCARWSPDGRFLASGSDDSMVMLWRLAGAGERQGAVPFGGKAATQHEKWRCAWMG